MRSLVALVVLLLAATNISAATIRLEFYNTETCSGDVIGQFDVANSTCYEVDSSIDGPKTFTCLNTSRNNNFTYLMACLYTTYSGGERFLTTSDGRIMIEHYYDTICSSYDIPLVGPTIPGTCIRYPDLLKQFGMKMFYSGFPSTGFSSSTSGGASSGGAGSSGNISGNSGSPASVVDAVLSALW